VAVATVDIQVNSQGAVSSIRNVNAAASQLERQINNTNRSVKQLETAFAGLGVAVAGINALNIAKDFFATANAADAAQRRIKLVSAGLDDYRVVLQTAKDAASKFGLSQTQASQAVADIYTRLRPVGFSLSAINAIYEGFNTAVKLSGVEAGAASAAFLQLSQGLGSGTLQGDELRSVLEQMPSIAQAIAKELDISVGSIKKFGSEGKITSDVIVRALDRIRTEGADKLAQSLDTPQQRIVNLQNAFEQFQITVASEVAPAVIGAIQLITDAIEKATTFVDNLKTGFGLLASAFSGIGSGIGNINSALDGTIGKFAALGQSKGLMMLLNFLTLGGAGALSQIAGAGAKKNASKPFAAPIGPEMPVRLAMVGMDFGGAAGKKGKKKGKSAEERAAEKAAREAARLREETQKQLDSASRLSDLAEANLEIQVSSNAEERLKSEFDKASIERRMRFIDLQKEAKSEQERELLASAQLSEILIANNKYAKDKKDILEQQTRELYSQLDVSGVLDKTLQNRISGAFTGTAATTGFRTDINLDPNKQAGKVQEYVNQAKKDLADVQGKIVSLATTVESSIGSAMSNAISGVLQGTATVKDAFASMFKSIGDAFIQMATQMIAKALIMKVLGILGGAFGGGGGIGANNYSSAFSGGAAAFNPGAFSGGMSFFANGGFVNSPTNAIIGEGGQPEYVIPASKMRESMSRYAAGARGSAVIGNGTSDGDLGGGAATMNGSTIDVRYTVERINSVDYVTASQFQQGMQKAAMEGAQRGQQATLRRLQNSSSTRRSVGI
jgi:tape measure domain-containing protein